MAAEIAVRASLIGKRMLIVSPVDFEVDCNGLRAAYAPGLIEASSDPAPDAECADSPQPVTAMPLHGLIRTAS
jgi:hypothetical protein